MKYQTQMEAARKGILTKEMEDVLARESINRELLVRGIAQGQIVIPANKKHTNIKARAIGEGLTTKINVNLGVSKDICSFNLEMEKAQLALEMDADAVMDLSISGDTRAFRNRLVQTFPYMIGTVPIYDTLTRTGKKTADITVEEWFETVEMHAEDGVDFITIHAGLNLAAFERIKQNRRLAGVVSRGGSILMEWMHKNQRENPFFEDYDRLLDICRQYDMCISLGDGMRPGALKDATDAAQIQELITLGELTKQAWEKDVQVMIEGPGHVPLNEVETNIKLQKKLCHGAPFYVLGPIVTDIAPGYDHITSAIGGALAAMHGADFLCYVTPAEHLRLPDPADVKEGIIAAKIAAHSADIAKGVPGARDIDDRMSKARADLDWEVQFECALDPEKAIRYRKSSEPEEKDVCTMCGEFCAVKRSGEILNHRVV